MDEMPIPQAESRTYPVETKNPNVPDGAYLLAEIEDGNGPELVQTYYVDGYGFIWRVSNHMGQNPVYVNIREACQVTGDTENMIHYRWLSYLRQPKTKQEV